MCKKFENRLGGLVGVGLLGVDEDFGIVGFFVGVVYAGEVFDFAGEGFLVEAFGVALGGGFYGDFDVDFDEVALRVEGSDGVAVGAVRADEGGEGDDAGIGEEPGDLAYAADVFGAVVGGEPQVLIEAVADVVAVETVGEVAFADQQFLEQYGDGGFAAGGEAGEPEGDALLVEKALAVGTGDLAVVPGDVGGLGHGCRLPVSSCQS